MSRWFIITSLGYKETTNPPNHDHWTYDWKTDTYYEDCPNYVMKCKELEIERKKGQNNDN